MKIKNWAQTRVVGGYLVLFTTRYDTEREAYVVSAEFYLEDFGFIEQVLELSAEPEQDQFDAYVQSEGALELIESMEKLGLPGMCEEE